MKWLVAGVVIAALLVAGTLLMDRGRSGAGPAGSAQSTATASGAQSASNATAGADATATATLEGNDATKTAGSSGKAGSTTPSEAPQDRPVPLEKVTEPPTHTVAFVDAKACTAGSAYAVSFVPYGIGPNAKTLVVRISASKPNGKVAKPYDFVDHNVLVDTSRLTEKMSITKGGRYTGTILLQKQDDVLAPILSDTAPAK